MTKSSACRGSCGCRHAQSAGRRVQRSGAAHRPGANAGGGSRGSTLPAGLRGRDPCGRSSGRGTLAPQGIYAEALYPRYHFGWSELLSLTDDRYRYIKAPREELYDLERDPDEQANLARSAGRRPRHCDRRSTRSSPGGTSTRPRPCRDDDRQRLAALGYVGTQSLVATGGRGTIRPDPKDKAPLLRTYRQAVVLIGAGRLERGQRLLRRS